jgi:hypothetical protein
MPIQDNRHAGPAVQPARRRPLTARVSLWAKARMVVRWARQLWEHDKAGE